MKDKPQGPDVNDDPRADPASATPELHPLAGEPGIPDLTPQGTSRLSAKALLAVALLLITVVAAGVLAVRRVAAELHGRDAPEPTLARDKPSAASARPHRLDLTEARPPGQGAASAPIIPALRPLPQDAPANLNPDPDPDPIAVRAWPPGAAAAAGARVPLPEDAPVLLLSSRAVATPRAREAEVRPTGSADAADAADADDAAAASGTAGAARSPDPMTATTGRLQDYQRRLQRLLEQLTQSAGWASNPAQPMHLAASPSPAAPSLSPAQLSPAQLSPAQLSHGPASPEPFGAAPQASATPKVRAAVLGDRSLTLPKGTAFTCALKTRVISATSGLIGCVLQRNLYGDDGRVVLAERGSHLDGEYRSASIRPGTVRIPVLWTRLRTPLGVTVALESPGTGPLGESGIDGDVDNRWGERIGAAMLLSLIDDSVKLVIQNQAQQGQADTLVLPSTTANSSKLAEKVLDSTIHIPPLIYQNQGGIVGIYVARDIDFSSVYTLEPTPSSRAGAPQP